MWKAKQIFGSWLTLEMQVCSLAHLLKGSMCSYIFKIQLLQQLVISSNVGFLSP